jgi:hypothetical protein
MATGGHGVRMQYDYLHDIAGRPGAVSAASPLWLRLTRSGATLTGYESSDGTHWTKVGTTHLAGLASTVQAGLFVTSPEHDETEQHFGGTSTVGGPSQATATFDGLSLQGGSSSGSWADDHVGGSFPDPRFQEAGGTFTVSGSGDIAPAVAGPEPNTVEASLIGVFPGLIVMIVLGAVFMTSEYRRGLIRTTLIASPRRGRALAAKAVVLGGVTFVTGLGACWLAFWLVGRIRRDNGVVVLPVTWPIDVRVVVGTAALLALAAVLTLAVGTVLRRSAAAVTTGIVLVVLPWILAVASVLPAGPAGWLLRVTPAAGFAIQQSIPEYPQVGALYAPATGYYPLAPWAGFTVLCVWTALALALAFVLIRRRDA